MRSQAELGRVGLVESSQSPELSGGDQLDLGALHDPIDPPQHVLDAAKSRFVVRATASGLLSAFGHNPTIAIRNFTGEAWFRAQAPDQSSLQFKIDACLEHWSRAVCCIYPAQKKITVFAPNQWFEFRDNAQLEFPSILPGFSVPLSTIFEIVE